MKIFKNSILALAAIALISFSSCNNDEIINNGGNTGNKGEAATLKVSIAPVTARAAELHPADKVTDMLPVKEAMVIIFNEDGTINGYAIINQDQPKDFTATVETTTDAHRVLVVSNLNGVLTNTDGDKLHDDIKTLATLNDRVRAEVELDGTAGPVGATADSLVILAGDVTIGAWAAGTTGVDIDADGNVEKTIELDIRPVSAKLSIAVNIVDEILKAGKGNLRFETADGLRILNAVSKTNVIGTTPFVSYTAANYPWLVPNTTGTHPKAFFSGMNTSGFDNDSKGVVKSFLADDMNDDGEFHYYLFENNGNSAAALASIVVIEATWGLDLDYGDEDSEKDANGLIGDFNVNAYSGFEDYEVRKAAADKLKERSVYFRVLMTSEEAGKMTVAGTYGTGIQRGKAYEMTLTLSEKLIEGEWEFPELPLTEEPGEGPDPTDPTEEDSDARLIVEVKVINWEKVEIENKW